MALFSLSLEAVLKHEGGFVQDPDDTGGATNLGITHKTLAEWRGKPVTVEDVKALMADEAGEIYKARYWDVMGLDGITSQKLAEAVMDFGVNAGTRVAVKKLQQAANWVHWQEIGRISEDGRVGPITTRFVNTTNERVLILKYFQMRIEFYREISKVRPSNKKFLYAWLSRSLDHVLGDV